jgi:hypothetical protein
MTKNIGYKSILAVTTTTGAAEIAQIRNISGPGVSANDVDTTTLDSSTNYRTFACGLLDPGEVSMQLVYDPAAITHRRLALYMGTKAAKTFTVYHGSSTGDSDAFIAYVKGMSREIPLDDLITCDVTLKVSGVPSYNTT